MANYANAKATIAANIYTNHLGQVTAEMVKTAADAIVDTLIAGGYLYAGVAKLTPTQTDPGSPDANVFYIATEPGTYTNFVGAGGSLVVANGEVAILKYNGTWSKEVTGAATAASVTELGQYDVTKNNPTAGPNNDGKWESLSALLSDANLSTLIPVAVRCGGMSIRFVQTSDNKYVQYRLTSDTFTTTASEWQKQGAEVSVSQNTLSIGTDKVSSLDFVNVNIVNNVPTTPYGGNVGARNAVPASLRNYGVTIQYLLSDGWHISKFIGDDLEDWADLTKWSYPFGDIVTNYYYEYVITDKDNHILFCILSNGDFYFGKGCPPQIKDLLDKKVDKETNKALLNAMIANGMSVSEANRIIDVVTDKTGKIVEAIYDDGFKFIPKLKAYFAELYDIKLYPAAIESIKRQLAETFCNYEGGEFRMFKKCICIGDSLTAGVFNYFENGSIYNYITEAEYSYPTYLKKISGVDVVNMGRGGFTSVDWYNEYKNTDLSGYDVALIQLGVNDSNQFAGWTQNSIDAFTNIINKLKTDNKKIKIYVSTITPVTAYSGSTIDAVSKGIRELVKTLNDENVILVDMAKYGHTAESAAYNCQHLSAFGYWRLAKDWFNIISYLINSNKQLYREVQFIGTDYYFEN